VHEPLQRQLEVTNLNYRLADRCRLITTVGSRS
jgi:hypothetical protein